MLDMLIILVLHRSLGILPRSFVHNVEAILGLLAYSQAKSFTSLEAIEQKSDQSTEHEHECGKGLLTRGRQLANPASARAQRASQCSLKVSTADIEVADIEVLQNRVTDFRLLVVVPRLTRPRIAA
ncbi:hypothetical protein CEP51_014680 [Fusarium floridanum]|uniref:Uncharacterized protein n=1 Tax=Fusarium floridanum TaxID=1325733 RepID=A0A428PNH9_9HYPO|nr:hypothetical protein CEP51_014680 [Fusarium floridanum]